MSIIKNKYELLDYAERKGMPAVYDIIDKIQPMPGNLACTDGTTVYVDPYQFNALDFKDQFFILAHELLHILYKHPKMSTDEYPNRKLLNICQDIVINEYLQRRLRYREPHGLYLDNFSDTLMKLGIIHYPITYSGTLTTSALYRYLNRYMQTNEMQQLIDSMDTDIMEDQESEESTTPQLLKELCSTLKITQEIMAKEMRLSENDAEENLEYADDSDTNPSGSVTYRAKAPDGSKILSTKDIIKFVEDFIGNNAVIRKRSHTYTRPNRRIQSSEFVMKGHKYAKNIKEIAIYLDTSGSMDRQFCADMFKTLKNLYQTTKFKFYQFDYYVTPVDFEQQLYVGGGTSINTVLNHINQNNHDVAIMITDCEDQFSLKNVTSKLMIFTNNLKFKPDNKAVKVSYFK